MSYRRKNIVLEGAGVRVRCKDEEVERTMVFHHILVSVPRTFGDYCNSDSDIIQILAGPPTGPKKWGGQTLMRS